MIKESTHIVVKIRKRSQVTGLTMKNRCSADPGPEKKKNLLAELCKLASFTSRVGATSNSTRTDFPVGKEIYSNPPQKYKAGRSRRQESLPGDAGKYQAKKKNKKTRMESQPCVGRTKLFHASKITRSVSEGK